MTDQNDALPPKPRKFNYVGAPAIHALELALQPVHEAFVGSAILGGIYHVGSSLERPDWRDVDLRCMLEDDAFYRLFPDATRVDAHYTHDARWIVMCIAISHYLRAATGLPIDFQFQPTSHGNAMYGGKMRSPMGRRWGKITRAGDEDDGE